MKKVIGVMIGVGIFTTGMIFGKQIQKKSNNTVYAGTLQVYTVDGAPELYLALSIPPEQLINSADVIFKVNKIKGE